MCREASDAVLDEVASSFENHLVDMRNGQALAEEDERRVDARLGDLDLYCKPGLPLQADQEVGLVPGAVA